MKNNFFLYLLQFLPFFLVSQSIIISYDKNGNQIAKSAVQSSPFGEIIGNHTICYGDTLYWLAKGGEKYRWSNGSTSPIMKMTPLSSGTFSLTVTSSQGCENVIRKTFEVLQPLKIEKLDKSQVYSNDGLNTFHTEDLPNVNYVWTIINGNIISGQGSSSIQVKWDKNVTGGQVSVYALSDNGCNSNILKYNNSSSSDQTIKLENGWNLVSTYIEPSDKKLVTNFKNLIETGVLETVKDIENLYNPKIPVGNSLLELENGKGYWVNVNQNNFWTMKGLKVSPEVSPIQLKEGWNLIGYLPYQALSPEIALGTVLNKIKLVKDAYSSFNPGLPSVFNTLHSMEAGKGYWIEMKEPGTLVFPVDKLEKNQVDKEINLDLYKKEIVKIKPNSTSGVGKVLFAGKSVPEGLLVTVKVGDEVRAIGRTFLFEGESYVSLVINSSISEKVTFYLNMGEKDYISSYKHDTEPGKTLFKYLPLNFGSLTNEKPYLIYPNPTLGNINLRVNIKSFSDIKIKLLDITGREIKDDILSEKLPPGIHNFQFDLSSKVNFSAGVYWLKIHFANETFVERIIIFSEQ